MRFTTMVCGALLALSSTLALLAAPRVTLRTPPPLALLAAPRVPVRTPLPFLDRPLTLSGLPTALVLDEATGRAFVGVHSFASGHVAVVDTRSGQVTREIGVAGPPLALALTQGGRRIFVLTEGTDLTGGRGRLYALDGKSGAVQHSVLVGTNANALAVDSVQQRVLVTAQSGTAATLTLYNAATLAQGGRLTLETTGRPIVVVVAGAHALLATSSGRAYLIDDATLRVVRVMQVGQGVAFIGLDPAASRAFVADQVSDTVTVLDEVTGAVLRRVPVGLTPSGLAVDAATHRVLVTNAGDGTLTLLDSRTGTTLRVVSVGTTPRGVAVDERSGLAAIPVDEGVSIVDAATGALLRRVAVGLYPVGPIVVGGQPALALAASLDETTLHRFTLAASSPRAPIAAPSHARSIAVVEAFVDAYNTQNLAGVLATVADDIDYGDCNDALGYAQIMHGKGALTTWLQARFAEHDRFAGARIGTPVEVNGQPGVSLSVIRISDVLRVRRRLVAISAKIGLTRDGSRLQALRTGGGKPSCPSVVVQ